MDHSQSQPQIDGHLRSYHCSHVGVTTLPGPARAAIIEYVEEKAAGIYGHSKAQRRRFIAALAGPLATHRYFMHSVPLQPELSFQSSKQEEIQNALASVLQGEHWRS